MTRCKHHSTHREDCYRCRYLMQRQIDEDAKHNAELHAEAEREAQEQAEFDNKVRDSLVRLGILK